MCRILLKRLILRIKQKWKRTLKKPPKRAFPANCCNAATGGVFCCLMKISLMPNYFNVRFPLCRLALMPDYLRQYFINIYIIMLIIFPFHINFNRLRLQQGIWVKEQATAFKYMHITGAILIPAFHYVRGLTIHPDIIV